MNKSKGRYRVQWEEGGIAWKSYTDDLDEALAFKKEKESVTDHEIIITDLLANKYID